jgi:iron complex outermembrane receptor protein
MTKKPLALVHVTSAGACLSVGLLLISGSAVHAQATPSQAPAAGQSPAVAMSPAPRANRSSRTARPQDAARRQASPDPSRQDASVTLTPINVQGAREKATGPVDGYVAKQSATGTKADTPILENPQSVSVVGRQQLEQQGSQTVAESLRYTAGVLAGSRPGNRFDDVFIRGFGGFGFTAGYVQFLDGLKMQRGVSYAVPNIDAYGLERVEVIKGPASVLYGQSNPGGLVNMVSKRPTERTFREVEFQVGNYSRTQAAFDMGGALDKDGRLLYRLTGLGLNSSTSVDFTDQQRIFIAPALTWRPSDDTTITFLNHYQNDPKSFQPNYLPAQGLLPGQPGVPANPYGRLPTSFYVGDPSHDSYKRELFSTGYEFEHRFSEVWTVRQNLRYQHLTSEFYAIPANPGYVNTANPNAIQRARTSVDEAFGGVVVDNQAEAKFNTGLVSHKMLFGIDYQYSDARRLLGQARGETHVSVIPAAISRSVRFAWCNS